MDIESKDFDRLARRAYDKVPAHFKDEMENVAFTIEENPPQGLVPAGKILLGLFEGVAKTALYSPTSGIQPSKITLFQNTIVGCVETLDELERLVLEVLMHEIAHYFGYNDQQMLFMDAKLREKLRKGGGEISKSE